MYRIIDSNGERILGIKLNTFMGIFNEMNLNHPDSYIIYQTKKNIQIVWNPLWDQIDVSRF